MKNIRISFAPGQRPDQRSDVHITLPSLQERPNVETYGYDVDRLSNLTPLDFIAGN